MHLRKLLLEAGPWGMGQDPVAMYEEVRAHWGGARVFMTHPAVRREWVREGRDPQRAAERLAAAIAGAITARGGTDEHVARVLTACLSSYLEV